MKNLRIKMDSLIDNPTARIPIVLCLDCSPSMSGVEEYGASPNTIGVPIYELNEGVQMFFNALKEDEIAKYSAEVSVVAFSEVSTQILKFDYIGNVRTPILKLDMERGGTSIGTAVKKSLKILENRKEEYKRKGVDYYQPWLVLMTDGGPTDNSHVSAAKMVSKLVRDKKLAIFPIGIGNGADMDTLKMFTPDKKAYRLKGLKFKAFFEWLSQSVSRVSQSTPGDEVLLNKAAVRGWGNI